MCAAGNRGFEVGGLPVQGNRRRFSHRTGEEFFLSVHCDRDADALFPCRRFELDARRQERVGNCQLPEIEQAMFLARDVNGHKMERIQGSDLQYAQRRHSVGLHQLRRKFGDAVHGIRMAHGNTLLRQRQFFRYAFGEMRRQCAAAHQQHRLRFVAVQLHDLMRDGVSEFLYRRKESLQHFIGGHMVFHAENVGEPDFFPFGGLALDALGDIEIEQEMLAQGFSDLVARLRYHTVCDDAAVLRDRHVGGARADIDEHEVQMAHGRRNQYVDRGNRLQGDCLQPQARRGKGRVHRVDDLSGQECRDDRGRCLTSALTDQGFQLISVQCVFDGAVANAIVMRRIVDLGGFRELYLRRLHAREIETALIFGGDDAGKIHFRFGSHRVKRAPRSGNGYAFQRAGRFLQRALDLVDDRGDLRHVVNLPVEHGAGLVLPARRIENLQRAVRLLLGDNADNAPGADIKREKMLLFLRGFLGSFRGLGGLLRRRFARRAFLRAAFFRRGLCGRLRLREIERRGVFLGHRRCLRGVVLFRAARPLRRLGIFDCHCIHPFKKPSDCREFSCAINNICIRRKLQVSSFYAQFFRRNKFLQDFSLHVANITLILHNFI